MDQPDESIWLHGVVSLDKKEALFAYLAIDTLSSSTAPRFTIPGLDSTATYLVKGAFPTGVPAHAHNAFPSWVTDGAQVNGSMLESVGLPAPVIAPESGFVIEIKAL